MICDWVRPPHVRESMRIVRQTAKYTEWRYLQNAQLETLATESYLANQARRMGLGHGDSGG
jgi:hypothetical protein